MFFLSNRFFYHFICEVKALLENQNSLVSKSGRRKSITEALFGMHLQNNFLDTNTCSIDEGIIIYKF